MCYIYYNQDFSKYLKSNHLNIEMNDNFQYFTSQYPLFIHPNINEDELNEEFNRELNLNSHSNESEIESDNDLENDLDELNENDQHFRIVNSIQTDNFDLFVSYINREFSYDAIELAKVIYNLTPGNLHQNRYFNHLQFNIDHEFLIGCIYEYATSLLTSNSN